MMWEGAWLDWARSAKGGYLAQAEAQGQWKAWTDDPHHIRDNDGPRGAPQLAAKVSTQLENYDDFAKTKER
eukprot:5985280-Alexandrium_andersonii.AAC.1